MGLTVTDVHVDPLGRNRRPGRLEAGRAADDGDDLLAALEHPTPAIAGLLARSGWTLDEVRPEQVRMAPGRYAVVGHRVVARDRHGHRRGLRACVEARRHPRVLPEPPSGLAHRLGLEAVADTVGRHHVWIHPYDPDLPALADAVSGAAMRARLRDAGLVDGPVLVHARLLRHRPGRRAVVRYQVVPRPGRGGRPPALRSGRALDTFLFAKVVRSDRADRIRRVADALRSATGGAGWRRSADLRLAIPSPLDDGLVVARAIGGTSLRERLLMGAPLPAPERLARLPALFDALAPELGGPVRRTGRSGEQVATAPLAVEERRHPVRLLEHAVEVLTDVLPDGRDALARASAPVRAGLDDWRPTAFVHGDLYDDQIFIDDDYRLGLIDLDDVGRGDPAIDAANLCAHLLALAAAVPASGYRVLAYRELVRAAFIERLDVSPGAFAWREALGLLRLATGPFRVQSARWPAESRHLVDLAIRLTSRE